MVVKATSGDTNLGGQDFVQRMMNHCLKEIEARFGKEVANDPCTLRDLRSECEEAKCFLSSCDRQTVLVKKINGSENYRANITRAQFESMNADLFNKTIDCVDKALKIAGKEPRDIDTVIMVGGASRSPIVIMFYSL